MKTDVNLNITHWAHRNFSGAVLGDQRRIRRVIDIAQKMAHSPGKSIPQLFENIYAIKATYQLFKHEKSFPENLQKGHRNLVYEQLKKSGTYLLIEDTSELSWSGKMPIQGLGPIGASTKGLQGFFLHSVMAVCWPSDNLNKNQLPIEIIGLLDQQYNIRELDRKKLKRKTARANTEKLESKVWEKTLERIPAAPQDDTVHWVRICDRGADIYEVLIKSLKSNYGFVIRSAYDRIIENKIHTSLFKYARSLSKEGSYNLNLRSRPNQPGRIATLSVAFGSVYLKSPQRPGYKRGALESVKCSVIRVWESNPPEGTEPIEWILLCDQQIATFDEALICINQYSMRWLIEDFHKALKTGLGAEKLQLESANRLFSAISIMSIVALRLVEIREVFRIAPHETAEKSGLSSLEIMVLSRYLKRQLRTVKDVNLAIGRLGGHMNRKNDGPPGLLTLWRGMKRLLALAEGVKLAKDLNVMESFG